MLSCKDLMNQYTFKDCLVEDGNTKSLAYAQMSKALVRLIKH